MVKHTPKIDLSIIIPVFNEEEGIQAAIVEIYKDAITSQVRKIIKSFEVIVVDDGSDDNTSLVLKNMKRYKKLRIITHTSNQGLGASIMTGVKYSNKRYITYLPADGQVFLREVLAGLKAAHLADLVLTYRDNREDYNPYRHFLSSSLMISMRFFFKLHFKDYNWVHIYNKGLFKIVKPKSKGVFYLAEIVARANGKGSRILEVPAKYHPRSSGYSKNAKPRIVLRTLMDLFKLWIELKFKPNLW